MPEFNNFSSRSLQAIALAREESRRLGHNFVGSEQVLLGLLGANDSATPENIQEIEYKLAPPKRTFTVRVRYQFKRRIEPQPYHLDDE